MSTTKTRFSDQRYLNWLKDTLSLLYLKEALENIIDTDAVQFHQNLQKALGVYAAAPKFCFNCTHNDICKDVRRQMWWMKCSLCDSWLQQIVQNHVDQPLPNLHRENIDPQLWPTRPYEVFKCYMPHGCKADQSAKDGDAQSILSLLKSCDYFSACGRIGKLSLVDELLRIRNSLFHSGKFFVDAIDLQMDIQTMLDFLRGLKSLSNEEEESVKKAIDSIEELQANKVDLSLNRELELQALQQQQLALEKDLSTCNAKLTAVDSDVKTIQNDVTSTATQGAAADLVLKTIQADIGTHSTRLAAVESEVKTLQEDVTSATSKSSGTELDVKTLTATTQGLELRMKTLQGVQDSFNKFLQANDLEQDMSKLSKTIEQHEEKIQSLEEQTQTQFQAQRSELESCKRKLSDHEEMLTTKELKVCSEVTDADITVLQNCLIDYYKTMCLTVPNPVEDDDVGLNRVYVDPDIKVLRDTIDPSGGLVKVEDEATSVSHCRRLFRTKDYRCKQIYLTGDAGSGKSMYCRHLLSLWCETHDDTVNASSGRDCSDSSTSRLEISKLQGDEETKLRQQDSKLQDEDRQIMSEFTLLFFVSLRDASDKYHIDDMIDAEILQQIDDMQNFKASVLLKKVCCLIILDGLDEWVPPTNAKPLRFLNPGIPGRNRLNKSNVFLTTTRPWKLDVLFLKSSDIDKHVELVGFDKVASKTLYSQLIHLLNETVTFHKYDSFWAELKKKGLDHLHSVPVILTQLICLWFDDQDLGQSQVQLYCSMLEMLLKRSDKSQSDQTGTFIPKGERSESSLPDCLLEHPYCLAHQQLLASLSKVAFQALLNQKRENSLVFKSSQMGIFGVDKQNVDLCLKSGILSQNKVLGKRSVSEKKMTFLHKKLQEFLAAMFITNSASAENVISHVKSFCSTVETVLEMSQVWMFVSGIKPDMSLQLLTDLMTRIVFNNTSVQQSRQTLADPYSYTCIQRSVQTCLVDCVAEARSNGHNDFWLHLEDFVIDKETISDCLNSLLTSNSAAAKSVYITTGHVDDVEHPMLTADDVDRTLRQLQNTHCLQKLFLSDGRDVISNKTLRETIDKHSSNLTSLVLHHITFKPKLSAAVCDTLKHLSALELTRVTLRHEQRQHLLSSVSQAVTLRELKLSLLICTEHGRSCDPIDIASLTQLHTIDLQHMYIDKLPVAKCAEQVTLWDVTIPERQLRELLRELSSVTQKVTVALDDVTVPSDSGNRVDLAYLRHDDRFEVTQWQDNDDACGDSDDIFGDSPPTCTLSIHFHTRQQTTSEEGNLTQTCTQLQ